MAYFKYKEKNVYYEEIGTGTNTIVLLHGNTASSKMFADLVPYLQKDFKIVLIDFLGHGKSDRVNEFATDLWYDEALQVIELLKTNNYQNVILLGSSGGAIVAINAALEYPNSIKAVIADSFEGEHSLDIINNTIKEDRESSKSDLNTKAFYEFNHGDNWEQVVDNDTEAMLKHHQTIKNFYHYDLTLLKTPILFLGSNEDEFVSLININFYNELYTSLVRKVQNGTMHIFPTGGHPSAISNKEQMADLIKSFVK